MLGILSTVVYTIEDVTEHRTMEQQLNRAERLESIGQLAGGIAHDMNNYLGCIMLQIGLLRATLPENELHARYCSDIDEVCEQARAVVRQLLKFGQRSHDLQVAVDVNSSCSASLAMLRRLIDRSVEIE